jgi:hypothetical protein
MSKFSKWIDDLPEGMQVILTMLCLPPVVGISAFCVFLIATLWHEVYLKFWWLT